jgi:hypothetical protein
VALTKKLIFVLLFTIPTIVFAQNATIKGKVVDEDSGDNLIAATVVLLDATGKTITGANTKYDGTYLLKNVKPGSYQLKFQYIGYQTKTVDKVEVKPDDKLTFDITLAEESVTTDVVVVTARAVKDNSAALLKDRQKSAASQDAIGAEEMSKKGASDAGDALKKVTGVTIQDGKSLVVRGLSNRYAKTQLNGAALPSADADSRSVDLDMFSTGMIENIVTIKTATPDKPGDFTGGAVDIKTKSYPDEFFVNVGLSSNYNFQVTGEELLIGERQSTDWLGYDDGSRAMPNDFNSIIDKYGNRLPGFDGIDNEELAEYRWVDVNNDGLPEYIDEEGNHIKALETFTDRNGNGRYDQGERYIDANDNGQFDFEQADGTNNEYFLNSEIFNDQLTARDLFASQDMAPVRLIAPVSTGFSFGIGDQYKIGKSTPIGFVANLNYNRSFNSYQNGVFGNWELTNATADSLELLDYFTEQKGQENVLLSTMLGVTTTLFKYNEIGVNFIYNQASTNEGRYFNGISPGGSGIPGKGITSITNRFTDRNLYSFQFSGKHNLNFLKSINLGETKLDWQVTTSENQRHEPNFRLFAFVYEPEVEYQPGDPVPFNPIADVDTINTETGQKYNPEVDGAFNPQRDSLDYSAAAYGINQSFQNPAIRIFRDMNETNLNFAANLEIPMDDIIGIPFKLKTGGLIEQVERSFTEQWVLYEPDRNFFPDTDINGNPYQFDPAVNLNSPFERLVGRDSVREDRIISMNYRRPEINSYTATQNVNAFYAMADFKVFKKFRVITGARVEQSELLALPLDTTQATLERFQGEYANINNLSPSDSAVTSLGFEDFGINETDILPSLNLVYELNKNSNLRAAYYKTLARPNMREMAPYFSFEFVGGFLNNGNPFLQRTLIDNYDLRYEWFPNVGELIAVSVYYKDFENPIERAIVTANNEIRFLNAPSAWLVGAEFELRKNVGNLVNSISGLDSKTLKKFDVSFNLSLTDAQVDVPQNSRDAEGLIDFSQDLLNDNRKNDSLAIVAAGGTDFSSLPSTVVDTNRVLKRDFVGQSPYVVNFDISYTDPELGLNISTNFNVFGRRLDFVQLGRNPDVYELPRPDLNFIISKVFFENLKVKLNASNLLNPYTEFAQNYNGEDYTARRFRRGTAISLSVSYKF